MSIETKITYAPNPAPKSKYPYVGVRMPDAPAPVAPAPSPEPTKDNGDLIVLFTGPGEGVVISTVAVSSFGMVRFDWDESLFSQLNGTVEISQSVGV